VILQLAYELHDQLSRLIHSGEDSPMSAADTKTKSKAEADEQIESKPMIESKTGEAKGKSLKLWVLIGALALLVVAGGVFMTVPHFKGMRDSLFARKAKPAQEAAHAEVKAVLPLEPFLVNLADTDEVRFVKTTFQLGLEEEWKEESKNSVAAAAIRDSIISLLSSKTAAQIMTAEGKNKLREEVRSRVNSVSPKIKVIEVYIVDFVVQL
jgi:flagellar protein FliL